MNIQRMASTLYRNYMINTSETSPDIVSNSSNTNGICSINNHHPLSSFRNSGHVQDYYFNATNDPPFLSTGDLSRMKSSSSSSSNNWDTSNVDSFHHVENLHTLLDLLEDDPPEHYSGPHNTFLDRNFEYFSDDIPNYNMDHHHQNLDEIITIATSIPPNNTMDCQINNGEEMKSNLHNKQRIRWTTELHDLFLDAIQTLGGPEFATPKKILGIMNVKGLSIYHVKSHLQKYRLARNSNVLVPDLKQNNKETYHNNDKSNSRNVMPVTEALQMQIELQKLLHEQLKAHRELQLSIEQNAEFLRRLIEKQNNNSNPKTNPDDHHSSSSAIIINDNLSHDSN
ncbi:Homeodomain-like superfamily protein [Euphorbia peplus]|nr:Homeodomain-like superfamily protein [Euphorbia peplus]